MTDKDATRIFDDTIALCKVFGGNAKRLCLEKGMPEQLFDKLFKEYQRFAAFLAKHDSDGSVKPSQMQSPG